jgi:hypothetical protein
MITGVNARGDASIFAVTSRSIDGAAKAETTATIAINVAKARFLILSIVLSRIDDVFLA